MRSYLFLEQFVPVFVLGSSVMLALGAAAISVTRQSAAKQRIGELCVFAVLILPIIVALPVPPPIRWLQEIQLPTSMVQYVTPSLKPFVSDYESNLETPPIESVLLDSTLSGSTGSSIRDTLDTDMSQPSTVVARGAESWQTADREPEAVALMTSDVSRFRLPVLAISLYLIGMVLVVMWMLIGKILLWRVIRRAAPAPNWLWQAYAPLRDARTARVLVAKQGTPFSCGILRPTIVIPERLCEPASQTSLRDVLLHEQAHVERYDAVGHTVLNLALPLIYFHPLYWFLRCQTLFHRELVADSWACQRTDRMQYVENLTRFVRTGVSVFLRPIGMLGISRFRSSFYRRMNALMRQTEPLATRTSRLWLFGAASLAMVFTLGCWLFVGGPTWASDDRAAVAVENQSEAGLEVPRAADRPKKSHSQPLLEPVGHAYNCELTSKTANVFAAADGPIQKVVQPGQLVTKGELIASIDDTDATAALLVAKQEWETQNAKAQSDTNVRYAKAHLELIRAELKEAQEAERRVPGSLSVSELIHRELRTKEAELAVQQAERDHRVSIMQSRTAAVSVEQAERLVLRYRCQAPIDGVVARMARSKGDFVKRGELVCEIQCMSPMNVVAYIPLSEYQPNLKKVFVRIERSGKTIEFRGDVAYVGSKVGPDQSIAVSATLENRRSKSGDWLLLPGMFGKLFFLAETAPTPAGATDNLDGQPASAAEGTMSSPINNHEALQELVDALTFTRDRVKAQYQEGIVEVYRLAQVETELAIADGRLAEAKLEYESARGHYESAVAHANARIAANQAAFDAGNAVTIDSVVEGLKKRVEAKTHLRRVGQMLAAVDSLGRDATDARAETESHPE